MSTTASLIARYQSAATETASGPQLLVMLYDRLAKDLSLAEVAIESGAIEAANTALIHAQQIVRLFHAHLDVDAFSGGKELADVYDYLDRQLVRANLTKNAQLVRDCVEVVEPLRAAWRAAAETVLREQQERLAGPRASW